VIPCDTPQGSAGARGLVPLGIAVAGFARVLTPRLESVEMCGGCRNCVRSRSGSLVNRGVRKFCELPTTDVIGAPLGLCAGNAAG